MPLKKRSAQDLGDETLDIVFVKNSLQQDASRILLEEWNPDGLLDRPWYHRLDLQLCGTHLVFSCSGLL